MIKRYLEDHIKADIGKHKLLVIYGARQVGKTTLAKKFLSGSDSIYYNCDQDDTRPLFARANLARLSSLVANYQTIVIDEAQRVDGIGLSLKILIDNFPEKNFIVTGSSSLDLARGISEPLTGRFFQHLMYPVSQKELSLFQNPIELIERIEERLIYGSYPEVVTTERFIDKERLLINIKENYLFKDALYFEGIQNSDNIKNLLTAVALQLGSEASLRELGKISGLNKITVKKYLDIAEKMFIIFSLPPYHTNKRKSIGKLKKYYFFDLGIRNALINNFNPKELRTDIGALWENFVIVERMKCAAQKQEFKQFHFWRSYGGHEIDLVEEYRAEIQGIEAKWMKNTVSRSTQEAFYDIGGKKLDIVTKENFEQFLL